MEIFKNLPKNKWFLTGLAVIIVGGGYFFYNKHQKAKASTPQYILGTVIKGTITSSVSGTGQVAASKNVDITPGGSGKVTAVYFKKGDAVKAGQTIATLDESSAGNSIMQAKASLESAQANYEKLLAGDSNTIDTAQLSVNSAQKSLQNAKDDYDQTVKDQDKAIAKAYSDFLNSGLSPTVSDSLSSGTASLSGTYTGTTQGSYKISLYQGGDGLHYQVNGLGSESGLVNRGYAQPIGNGLYITFSNSGTFSPSTIWTIDVPNVQSNNYFSSQTSYQNALDNKPSALKTAQQKIDSAQDSLTQAQTNLTQKQQPPTQADVDSAKAQIASAQVSLSNAATTYSNNIIKAPFDGVISALNVEVGQQASAATVAATIITEQDIAKISLNELDAAKVKAGQKATLSFSAISGITLTGTVANVAAVGTVSQNVVNFPVEIAFDTQNDQIKPGMSVTASIITNAVLDVLTVPSSAVHSNGGNSYVEILVNSQPQQITVTAGLSNNSETEISGSDIKEGDQIITQTITAATKTSAAASGNILQSITGNRTGAAARTGAGGFGGGTAAGGNVRIGN